jgi:hypothetical protein
VLDEFTDGAALDVDHAEMPPNREDLALMIRRVSVQLFVFSRCVLYKSKSAPTVSPCVARSAFFSSAGSAPLKMPKKRVFGVFLHRGAHGGSRDRDAAGCRG